MEDEGYLVVTLIKDEMEASHDNPVELFVDYNYTTKAAMKTKQRAMKKRRLQLEQHGGEEEKGEKGEEEEEEEEEEEDKEDKEDKEEEKEEEEDNDEDDNDDDEDEEHEEED